MGVRRARLALERPAEAFKGFEAGQTAGLNTFKSTWPWCLAAGVSRKSCLGWACGGPAGWNKLGHGEGHGRGQANGRLEGP